MMCGRFVAADTIISLALPWRSIHVWFNPSVYPIRNREYLMRRMLLAAAVLAGGDAVPETLAAPAGQPGLTPHRLRIPITSGTREVTL